MRAAESLYRGAFWSKQQQAETFPVGVSPGVLPLNETGGKVDLPSNCDKHSRGGGECCPAPLLTAALLKKEKASLHLQFV